MKISVLTEDKNLEIKKFARKEWRVFNLEHYGDEEAWDDEVLYFIKGVEGGEIVGFIKMGIESGVAYIYALLVKQEMQGKGFGEQLIKKAEELAKEKGCHKIKLETGKDWRQRSFYDRMGYTLTNVMPNHYFHKDFVEYTKML